MLSHAREAVYEPRRVSSRFGGIGLEAVGFLPYGWRRQEHAKPMDQGHDADPRVGSALPCDGHGDQEVGGAGRATEDLGFPVLLTLVDVVSHGRGDETTVHRP